MKKSLKDISWQVSESEYRQDSALSYSTLARYEREGFEKLPHLFDRLETPSLTYGSAVDALITGGQEEFDNNFIVAEFPQTPDTIIQIVKVLFGEFHDTHNSIIDIPNEEIIGFASRFNYQNNWKPETRAKVIKEKGGDYYKLLYIAQDKTILPTATYNEVISAVEALKNSDATSYYFAPDNPFENIERLYQLKFKTTLNKVDYRCMMDLAIINHDEKWVLPCDLKTSGHREYGFYESFKKWRYKQQ